VPFEIVYEDIAGGLTEVVHELAAFLGVAPPGLGLIRPRLRRQADHGTERLIGRFNSPARCSATGLVADATRAAAAEDAEGLS
jgi:LPS sulfotransferase NodH